MTKPAMQSLRERLGVGAALTTPFDVDGSVRWQALAAHAARLIEAGVSLVTVFGTTGEGASVDRATRAAALERTRRPRHRCGEHRAVRLWAGGQRRGG